MSGRTQQRDRSRSHPRTEQAEAHPREGEGKETEKGSRTHTDCRTDEHQRTADRTAQNGGDKRDALWARRQASIQEDDTVHQPAP